MMALERTTLTTSPSKTLPGPSVVYSAFADAALQRYSPAGG